MKSDHNNWAKKLLDMNNTIVLALLSNLERQQ